MKTDALKRRSRFAPPQPLVRKLAITEADLILFEAISRHGPLPTPYLYEFTKHLRRDYSFLQNRLTEFYNGDAGGSYLLRPPQQFASFEARYQPLCYTLAPRAERLLAERGTLDLTGSKGPFVHQLMQACVAATLELGAVKKGIQYISRQKILTRAGTTLALPLPSDMGEYSSLIPDDLFGFRYPEGGFRFFALEADRNTESKERKDHKQTSFNRKILRYEHVLSNHNYGHWSIPNLTVLTVTTSSNNATHLISYMGTRVLQRSTTRFAVAVEERFNARWSMPKLPLLQLCSSGWITKLGPRDIMVA